MFKKIKMNLDKYFLLKEIQSLLAEIKHLLYSYGYTDDKTDPLCQVRLKIDDTMLYISNTSMNFVKSLSKEDKRGEYYDKNN